MTNVQWGSATDTGMFRANNEDRAFAEMPVFVVADGIGGQASGEVASAIAVTTLGRLCGPATIDASSVLQAVTLANEAILAAAVDEHVGMGTTIAGLALVTERGEERWIAFNVGDSRVYRLWSGRLEQLTSDHTRSRVLMRALGTDPGPAVDTVMLCPTPAERFLLCSDGIHDELDDGAIRYCLMEPGSASDAASRLVRAALAAGGRDNLTAVVVDVDGEEPER